MLPIMSVNTSANTLGLILPITLGPSLILELVQLRTLGSLTKQDPALEPPRQDLGKLVLGVGTSRDAEDVIQLLESALLGFVEETEDHPKGDEIHGCVETESTLDAKGVELTRECDGDDCGPEVVGCHSPGHADFTMGEGEDLCGVRERDGTFARRVEGVVDVDEESHHAEMGTTALRDPVTHAGKEKTPTHVRECEQQQSSTSEGIDGPNHRISMQFSRF